MANKPEFVVRQSITDMDEVGFREWLGKRGHSSLSTAHVLRDRVIRLLQKEVGMPGITWSASYSSLGTNKITHP